MKRVKLLVGVGLVLALAPAASWAGGTPHLVYGNVLYSNGDVPQGYPELQFAATLSSAPGETLYAAGTGSGASDISYTGGNCMAWIQCSEFSQWNNGDLLSVHFWADGTHGPAYEENDLSVTLNSGVGSETWGDFYLPVELSSFSAEGGAGLVVLRWTTATETDNLGFWVWRSTDSDGEYAKVNEQLIPGAGTSVQEKHYSFTDNGLEAGTYFYKLEDVGATGVTQLHGPVEVEVMAPIPTEYGLSANVPNPVTDRTEIKFQLPEAARVKLGVYNVAGSLVTTLADGHFDAGYYRHEWSAAQVPSGIYFYRLEANDFSSTHRMVVLK